MPLGQKPLTDAEIAVVEQWITEGASWPANRQQASAPTVHWAYKRLQPVSPPRSTSVATENPIDRFVFSGLDQAKIPQNPRASKETLIRRLSFDLTGLPPSADQVEEYVHDTSPGATEKLIDKLLASPHFGERWGRHWLDLARYADSEGYENDKDALTLYRYRDFVIQAMNEDLPFDQFVRWQLAGDEIDPLASKAVVATGFLTAGPRVHTAASDSTENKERLIYDQLDDMISTVSVSMLATTVGCARCHDHKYDPIPTRDYYRMAATFRNFDRDEKTLSQAHWIRDRFVANERARLRDERMAALNIPESDREMLRWPLNRNHSGQAAAYREWDARVRYTDEEFQQWLGEKGRAHLAKLNHEANKAASDGEPPRATFMLDESATPRPSFLLARGEVTKKADAASIRLPLALTHGILPEDYRKPLIRPDADTTFRRTALAEWMVDAEHGAGEPCWPV